MPVHQEGGSTWSIFPYAELKVRRRGRNTVRYGFITPPDFSGPINRERVGLWGGAPPHRGSQSECSKFIGYADTILGAPAMVVLD